MDETEKGTIHRHLRAIFGAGVVADLGDGPLLERYNTRADESGERAFEALVARHGPMVLRACRAILKDEHGAQDAFQATFLVLARRGRSLRVRDSLAPWLHEVAVRVSSCARKAKARRSWHERRASAWTAPGRPEEAGDDLGRALHEEVGRLPGGLRDAVVMCDLRGMTHREAARQLRWPIGTVKSRQARGRRKLRERLTRRGLAPALGALGALLAAEGATASVPTALAGEGVAPASVVALFQSFAKESIMFKLRWAAVGLLALGIATAGAGALARQFTKPDPVPVAGKGADAADDRAVAEPDADLARLLKEQMRTAVARWDSAIAHYESGALTIDHVFRASRRLAEARRDLDGSRAGRIAAAREHLARIIEVKRREDARQENGSGSKHNVAESNDEHVRAKLELARELAGK